MDIETAYKTAQDRSLFVKFVNREAMMDSLNRNTASIKFHYCNGKAVDVHVSIAGSNVHYVRVFDLPSEVNDDQLSLVLAEYGKEESMVREKFPKDLGLDHVYTGVRGVHIDVQKEIPPAISVGNRKGHVFYDGLRDTCFLCHAVGHRKDACPQRKAQVLDKRTKSYAGVVSGQQVVTEERKSLESSEEIIEITEEDIIEESPETVDAEQVDTGGNETEKETRRKKGISTLVEVANAITEAIGKQQAANRRAQFASSGSKEHSRPKKLCARKSLY